MAPVADAIPAVVKALGKPVLFPFTNGIRMAITAADKEVEEHVLNGLNHLHGGWEFEAARHFAVALELDPGCLLAHWGMAMALLAPSPETTPARNAAVDRMLGLLDAGIGSGLERGYAYGLIKYIQEGPAAAASAFRKVAGEFPNDIQAPIFGALFGRSGYDETGDPLPGQVAAEATLAALVEKFPKHPVPLNALLMARGEAPDLRPSLLLARQLTKLVPDYAPFYQVLGHYEWRCGDYPQAAAAFGNSKKLYESWMTATKAGPEDCPGWVMAECYRIVALKLQGDFDSAYAAARQFSRTPFPPERAASPGARLILWEAKSLPARILMRRGLPGNTIEALTSLPDPALMKPYHDRSLAHWWTDGLRIALEAKRLIEAGDLEQARLAAAALTTHGEEMAKLQNAATALGERASWNRAFRALEVLASELQGRIAMAGPASGRGSALNWFRSAADRQLPATMLYPPAVLTPMASLLGEYYLSAAKPDEATEAFNESLELFRNDLGALSGLQRAAEMAKRPEEAAKFAAKIKELRNP
jgi:tetratricopeptide (TPR) repeat protein